MMIRPILLAALILGAAPVHILPAAADERCEPAFSNFIPRVVRKAEVEALDESYDVRLWSFCRGLNFFDTGNAGGLIRTIATKSFIVDPIEAKDWSVDDVKFIRIGDGFVDLWLHRDP